jgi:hypothetical protein
VDLSCPRCGLLLQTRGSIVDYCPRCSERDGRVVALIAASLMAGGAAPGAPADEEADRAAPAA